MNAFEDLVDSHISEGRVKLTRLLQYTDGPAKLAIQNCALVSGEKGYRRAREILKRRLGNAHLVSQKIINELRHGKSVHKGYELQKLADELSVAYTVLEDIDKLHEIDTQISIIDIAQRCPQFVRDKWRNKAIKHVRAHDCYPTFSDFVEFIELIAVAECDPVYGKGNNSKPANVRGVNYSTVTATVRNSGDTGTNSSAINSVNFKSVPSVLFVVEITGHSCVISSNLWGQKLGGNSSFVTNCVLTVYSLVTEQMNAGNLQFVPFQGVDRNTPDSFILTRHNQVLVGLHITSVMFKMSPRSHSHPMPVMAAVCHRW